MKVIWKDDKNAPCEGIIWKEYSSRRELGFGTKEGNDEAVGQVNGRCVRVGRHCATRRKESHNCVSNNSGIWRVRHRERIVENTQQ